MTKTLLTGIAALALLAAAPARADFNSAYQSCRWSGQNVYFCAESAHRQAWNDWQMQEQQRRLNDIERRQMEPYWRR
jgi:hypothetical protein